MGIVANFIDFIQFLLAPIRIVLSIFNFGFIQSLFVVCMTFIIILALRRGVNG